MWGFLDSRSSRQVSIKDKSVVNQIFWCGQAQYACCTQILWELVAINFVGLGEGGGTHIMSGRSRVRSWTSHPHNAATEHVGLSRRGQALLALVGGRSGCVASNVPVVVHLFFRHPHLISSFWTSRGHRCRPFFPSVLAFNFLSRIGFSNPTARRFLVECCYLMLSRFPTSQFVHKKKSPRIYTSMHSGGFELTKLTYTRPKDNLTRNRGDQLYVGTSA